MKKKLTCLVILISFVSVVFAQRQMENLNRGVIAVNQGGGKVYVGWRMFGTDSPGISFNVYRITDGAAPIKINNSPITASTDFVDTGVDNTKSNTYFVKSIINGIEQEASESYSLPASSPIKQYLSIPIKDGGVQYVQAGFGDIDGDGEYELLFKWSKSANVDPGSHTIGTATVYIDAYKLDGAFLWRIDLGWNLEPGSDFTPFLVYDVDGDGKAEIITRTSDGTIDGTGIMIGTGIDYRNADGRVIRGPEYMSVFRGIDGKEIARTNWIERGSVSDWGDNTGNRSCRYQMGIAYLDGIRPSIIMSRGVYAYQVIEAWNFRDNNLTKLWRWDNGGKGKSSYYYSTDQCLRIGDIDNDGKDEIIKGHLVVDEDGTELWNHKIMRGHGDFTHIGVLDPSREGLQIFRVNETEDVNGVAMFDGKTGNVIWGIPITGDAGRGYCSNIDARYKGVQCWAGQINNDLINYNGDVLCAGKSPSKLNGNMYWAPIWWDGLCRSLTDEHSGTDGVHIVKWNYGTNVSVSEYLKAGTGTRTIVFIGDLLGDWREELVIFQPDEVRIYTTTIPSAKRIYTLMHNPLYKSNVIQWGQRNAAPSHPDFYLGAMMDEPPMPNIYLTERQNTSIASNKISDDVVLFPNPVKDRLTVSVSDLAEKTTITVYNLNGILMYSSELKNNVSEIDMSAYNSGMYLVKLVNKKGVFVKQIIKK